MPRLLWRDSYTTWDRRCLDKTIFTTANIETLHTPDLGALGPECGESRANKDIGRRISEDRKKAGPSM